MIKTTYLQMEYMNKVKINNNFRLIIKLINSKLMNRLYRRNQQKVMMIINHVRKFIFYMLFIFILAESTFGGWGL